MSGSYVMRVVNGVIVVCAAANFAVGNNLLGTVMAVIVVILFLGTRKGAGDEEAN